MGGSVAAQASGEAADKTKVTVSVVMTAYKRPRQLRRTLESIYRQNEPCEVVVVEDGKDGETEGVCKDYPVKYLCRPDRPTYATFYNPAVVTNMGLRAATGDIVILQNAECEHVGDVISHFRDRVCPGVALFASVAALGLDEVFVQWYCHPEHSRRPLFFCGAMLRRHYLEVGLFDEDYTEYGYEDVDFADRLTEAGIYFEWTSRILAHHQWHERFSGNAQSRALYERKKKQRQGAV